jgi:hypothetical protein
MGSGGNALIPIDTRPCYVAGCAPGLVCDGMTCVEPPTSCPPSGQPACGADGLAYGSVCEANLAGVAVNPSTSACPTPPGYFVCDWVFCDSRTSFCNDPREMTERSRFTADELGCQPLPAECLDAPSCYCLQKNTPKPSQCCSASDAGAIHTGCIGEVP